MNNIQVYEKKKKKTLRRSNYFAPLQIYSFLYISNKTLPCNVKPVSHSNYNLY